MRVEDKLYEAEEKKAVSAEEHSRRVAAASGKIKRATLPKRSDTERLFGLFDMGLEPLRSTNAARDEGQKGFDEHE